MKECVSYGDSCECHLNPKWHCYSARDRANMPYKINELRHEKKTWFSNRSYTNGAVQAQKMARSFKFWI